MKTTSSLTRRDFLCCSALAAGGLALYPGGVLGEAVSAVPERRLQRLATGANVCRWFRFPRGNAADHFTNYISESEAAWMAELGLQHVRLCVQPSVIMEGRSGAIREERASQLESAIRRFHRAGLLVVVDIHNEDRAAELDPAWQDAFVKFWGTLAARLQTFDPDLTVLEFINEPVFANREEEWNALNARLASTIRAAAPEHTMMTSGPNWGGIDGLKKLKLLPDKNVVYSFHCYDPFAFTHQGATWANEEVKPLRAVPYPSSPEAVAPLLPTLAEHPRSQRMLERYGSERWNRERLAARFNEAIDWGRRHDVPLYCGEFGVFPNYAKPEHRAQWFGDFGAVLAAHRIGWAVWGWDEGFGLNRRFVDGKLTVDKTVATALGLKVA